MTMALDVCRFLFTLLYRDSDRYSMQTYPLHISFGTHLPFRWCQACHRSLTNPKQPMSKPCALMPQITSTFALLLTRRFIALRARRPIGPKLLLDTRLGGRDSQKRTIRSRVVMERHTGITRLCTWCAPFFQLSSYYRNLIFIP